MLNILSGTKHKSVATPRKWSEFYIFLNPLRKLSVLKLVLILVRNFQWGNINKNSYGDSIPTALLH